MLKNGKKKNLPKIKTKKKNSFPEKGSLSVDQLRKVEEQLGGEEQQMLRKKNVKLADVHRINNEKINCG